MEFLDSIRGLAALAVLLGHSLIFVWPASVGRVISWPFVNMIVDGHAAVLMFFVLSGFVLTRPYFLEVAGQPPRQMHVPTFYLRRFTRIWMPWLAVFGLSALAQVTIFHPWKTIPPLNSWYGWFWQAPLTWKNFFLQCVFRQHAADVQLMVQDWSLGVELKASALLPCLIYAARKFTPWSLLVISGLLVIWLPTGHYYTAFIFGVWLAHGAEGVVRRLKPRPLSDKIGLLVAGLLLYEASHFFTETLGWRIGSKYPLLATGMGCALILLASLSSRRIQAVLNLSPLVFLGKISYSVYLLQFIIILCLLPPWIHCLNLIGMEKPVWLLPLSLIFSVGVTVGLSALSYRYIETPCIELGQWLSKKRWATCFKKS